MSKSSIAFEITLDQVKENTTPMSALKKLEQLSFKSFTPTELQVKLQGAAQRRNQFVNSTVEQARNTNKSVLVQLRLFEIKEFKNSQLLSKLELAEQRRKEIQVERNAKLAERHRLISIIKESPKPSTKAVDYDKIESAVVRRQQLENDRNQKLADHHRLVDSLKVSPKTSRKFNVEKLIHAEERRIALEQDRKSKLNKIAEHHKQVAAVRAQMDNEIIEIKDKLARKTEEIEARRREVEMAEKERLEKLESHSRLVRKRKSLSKSTDSLPLPKENV